MGAILHQGIASPSPATSFFGVPGDISHAMNPPRMPSSLEMSWKMCIRDRVEVALFPTRRTPLATGQLSGNASRHARFRRILSKCRDRFLVCPPQAIYGSDAPGRPLSFAPVPAPKTRATHRSIQAAPTAPGPRGYESHWPPRQMCIRDRGNR